jgi:hypothetical protein
MCVLHPHSCYCVLTYVPDIIALLIVGFFLMVAFVFWQHYLERTHVLASTSPEALARSKSTWRPPPLMKLSLWKRAKGKFAVIQGIAFLNWCSFISWYFWTQVSRHPASVSVSISEL